MTVDEILEELERLLRDVDSYHQMREGLRKIIEQSGDEHVGTASRTAFKDLDARSLAPPAPYQRPRGIVDPGFVKEPKPTPSWRFGEIEQIDYSKLIFHTDEDNVW